MSPERRLDFAWETVEYPVIGCSGVIAGVIAIEGVIERVGGGGGVIHQHGRRSGAPQKSRSTVDYRRSTVSVASLVDPNIRVWSMYIII